MKALQWFFINGIIAGMVVSGIVYDNPIVNAGVALLWLSLIMQCLAFMMSDGESLRESISKTHRSVPGWFGAIFDASLSLFLGWHGWPITAVVIIVGIGLEKALYDRAAELRGEEAP